MANFDNRFLRAFAVTVDAIGVDPLLDKIIPKLTNITQFSTHVVTQDERGSPDLISFREYGSTDYWWHILAYNGIISYRSIVEGLSLRIPSLAAIQSITTDTVVRQGAQQVIKV